MLIEFDVFCVFGVFSFELLLFGVRTRSDRFSSKASVLTRSSHGVHHLRSHGPSCRSTWGQSESSAQRIQLTWPALPAHKCGLGLGIVSAW